MSSFVITGHLLVLASVLCFVHALKSFVPRTNYPTYVRTTDNSLNLLAFNKNLPKKSLPNFVHAPELVVTLGANKKKFDIHEEFAHSNTTTSYTIKSDINFIVLDDFHHRTLKSVSDGHVEHCSDHYSTKHVDQIKEIPTYIIGTGKVFKGAEHLKDWINSKEKRELIANRGLLVMRKATQATLKSEGNCMHIETVPTTHFDLFEHITIHSVGTAIKPSNHLQKVSYPLLPTKVRTLNSTANHSDTRKLIDPWFVIDSPFIECGDYDLYKNNGFALKYDPTSNTVGDKIVFYFGLTLGCAEYQKTLVSFNFNYDSDTKKAKTDPLTIPGVNGITCDNCYAYLGAGFEIFFEYDFQSTKTQPMFGFLAKMGGAAGFNAAINVDNPSISGSKGGTIVSGPSSYTSTLNIGSGLYLKYKLDKVTAIVSGSGSAAGTAKAGAGASFSGYIGVSYDTNAGWKFPYGSTFTWVPPYFTTTSFDMQSLNANIAVTGNEAFELSYSGYVGLTFSAAATGINDFTQVSKSRRRLDEAATLSIGSQTNFVPGDLIPLRLKYSGFNPNEETVLFYSIEVLGISEFSVMERSFISSSTGSGEFAADFVVPWDKNFAGDGGTNVMINVRCSNRMMRVFSTQPFAIVQFTNTDGIFSKPAVGAVLPLDAPYPVAWNPKLLKYFERDDGTLYGGQDKLSESAALLIAREIILVSNNTLVSTEYASLYVTPNTGRAAIVINSTAEYFRPLSAELVSKYYLLLRSTRYLNVESWSSGYLTFASSGTSTASAEDRAIRRLVNSVSHKTIAVRSATQDSKEVARKEGLYHPAANEMQRRKLAACSNTASDSAGTMITEGKAGGSLTSIFVLAIEKTVSASPTPVSLGTSSACVDNIGAPAPTPAVVPAPGPTPAVVPVQPSPVSAPATPSPTNPAAVLKLSFKLSVTSGTINKDHIKSSIANVLNLNVNDILSVLVDGARRLEGESFFRLPPSRALQTASTISVVASFPTVVQYGVISTSTPAQLATLVTTFTTNYNSVSGQTATVSDFEFTNITPTSSPVSQPVEKTPPNIAIAAGAAAAGAVGFLIIISWVWCYTSQKIKEAAKKIVMVENHEGELHPEGAFLADNHGFHPDGRRKEVPSPEDIEVELTGEVLPSSPSKILAAVGKKI